MSARYAIVLEEARIEKGEPLSGSVSAPPGEYSLVAKDAYGREVLREAVSVKDKCATFKCRPELAVSILHRLLLQNGKGRALAETQFEVAPGRFKWDDYCVIVWARYPDGFYDILRRHGIGASMAYRGNNFETLVKNDFPFYVEQVASSWLAYYHRSGIPNWTELFRMQKEEYRKQRPRGGSGLHHKACLSKDDTMRMMERRIAREALDHRFYKPLYYTLSDEAGITDLTTPLDLCFSPQCLSRFRSWLKDKYGSISALNEEWGSGFSSWSRVKPSTADQVLGREDGNYSSWADHREFMDIVLAEAFAEGGRMLKKYDPEGLSGLEGGQMPACYGGYDWSRLGEVCDLYEIYDIGENCEVMRSLYPDKVMLKAVFPQGTDWDILRVWYEFLHGDIGLILWDNGEEKARWVHPNKRPAKHTINLAATFAELQSGTGKLLHGAEPVLDPVGVLYSQPSVRAAWIRETEEDARNGIDWLDQGSAYGRLHSEHLRARDAMDRVIEDAGLQYRYASYDEISKRLDPREFKVFFLVQSAALSDGEVGRLRKYVRDGGVLVADALAGIFDEHVKRRGEGALDSLFGIKRSDFVYHPLEGRETEVLKSGGPFKEMEKGEYLPLSAAEPGVKAAKAEVFGDCGGVQCLFSHKYGKGTAVYLNLAPAPYPVLRLQKNDPGEPFRRLVGSVLKHAGVKPCVTIDFTGPGVETRVFRDGNNTYVCFMKNPYLRVSELGGDNPVGNEQILKRVGFTADLGKQRHVYDLRKSRYLGRKRKVKVTLGPAEPVILSLLPSKTAGIEAGLAGKPVAGRTLKIKGRVTGGRTGRRVVRAELADPAGECPWFRQWNVEAPNGKFGLSVPLEINATPGTWKLRLKDTSSGASASVSIRVRKEA